MRPVPVPVVVVVAPDVVAPTVATPLGQRLVLSAPLLLAPPSALPALLPAALDSTTSGYTVRYLLNNSLADMLLCAAAAASVERMDLVTLADPASDC